MLSLFDETCKTFKEKTDAHQGFYRKDIKSRPHSCIIRHSSAVGFYNCQFYEYFFVLSSVPREEACHPRITLKIRAWGGDVTVFS
jgi:hypothetical protein